MKNNMEEKYIKQALKKVQSKHPNHEVIYDIIKFADTHAIILKCINNNLIAYTYGYVVYDCKLLTTNKYATMRYKKNIK